MGQKERNKKKKRRKDVESEERKEEETSPVEGNKREERNRCNHTQGNNNEIFEISASTPPSPPAHPIFSSDTHLSTPSQLRLRLPGIQLMLVPSKERNHYYP